MSMQFTKAVKSQAKGRIGLIGPAGSGKTFTALVLATGLGGTTALIDTEHESASKYADLFEFDTLALTTFSPEVYIEAIHAAGAAGYDNLIIDSLSHAWAGTGGTLELVEKFKAKHAGNKFAAWGDVTPMQTRMIEAMLSSPCHLIVTIRSKMEYMQTEENGKKVVKKVGMQPIQRDGLEYEFDIVADMDTDHNFIVSKTRCNTMDGFITNKPTAEVATTIKAWLDGGAVPPAKPALTLAPPAPPAPPTQGVPATSGANPQQAAFYKQMCDWALIHGYPWGEVDVCVKKRLAVLQERYAMLNWDAMNGQEWIVPFQTRIQDDYHAAHPTETLTDEQILSGQQPLPNEQPPVDAAPVVPSTKPQQGKIHVEATRIGWSNSDLDGYLMDQYGVQSTKDLSKAEASVVIKELSAKSERGSAGAVDVYHENIPGVAEGSMAEHFLLSVDPDSEMGGW